MSKMFGVSGHSKDFNFWALSLPLISLVEVIKGNISANRTCAQILQNVDQNGPK